MSVLHATPSNAVRHAKGPFSLLLPLDGFMIFFLFIFSFASSIHPFIHSIIHSFIVL